MAVKYFDKAFAQNGDRQAIPDDTTVDGSVSYEEGYGIDYQQDQSSVPSAKNLLRTTENQFKYDVSIAVKEIQEKGLLPYDPQINYLIDGVVLGSDKVVYICEVINGPESTVVDPVGDLTGTWLNLISPPTPSSLVSSTIVDGGMNIWPEETTFAITDSNTYTANNFLVKIGPAAGGAGVVTRESFANGQTEVPGNPKYFLSHAVTSIPAGSFSEILNVVENPALNSGADIQFRFYAKSDANRFANVIFKQFFGTGGSPSASLSSVAATVSLTTNWQLFSVLVTVDSVLGKTFGTDENGSFSIGLSTPDTEGAHVIDTCRWWTGNSTFPDEDISIVSDKCSRYYQKSYLRNVFPGTASSSAGSTVNPWTTSSNVQYSNSFEAQMSVVPQVTIYSPSSGSPGFVSSDFGADPDIPAAVIPGYTSQGRMSVEFDSGTGATNNYSWHYTADARLADE